MLAEGAKWYLDLVRAHRFCAIHVSSHCKNGHLEMQPTISVRRIKEPARLKLRVKMTRVAHLLRISHFPRPCSILVPTNTADNIVCIPCSLIIYWFMVLKRWHLWRQALKKTTKLLKLFDYFYPVSFCLIYSWKKNCVLWLTLDLWD